jgi:hypothetical protein
MPGYRDLLAQTKKNIHEVTPAEAEGLATPPSSITE